MELFTLEPQGDGLRCQGCGRDYPVTEGIPVLLPAQPLPDLHGPEAPLLAAAGPDAAPVPHALAQLSTYLGPGFEELAAKLRGRPKVPVALELGCGAGSCLFELAAGAELLVGLDRSLFLLRAAGRLAREGELRYWRRVVGRHYQPAEMRRPKLANLELVCADALDPPFAPGTFDRIAALNLLDNVASPRALLHHLALLAAPRAELLISSPYAWRDGIVAESERLGGADPAEAVRAELRALGFRVEEEHEVPWSLRHDARAETHYRVHFLRAVR